MNEDMMDEDLIDEDMTDEDSEVVPEVSQESITELKIMGAFEDAVAVEKDEDEIKMAMLMAGCKFKKVSSIYNKLMIDNGFSASPEEKAEAMAAVMEGNIVSEEVGFEEACVEFASAVNGGTNSSAANAIRSYCKKHDIPVYTRPKGMPRAAGFKYNFFKELRTNPSMNADQADKLVKEMGSDNDYRYLSLYQTIRQLCNDISSDYS